MTLWNTTLNPQKPNEKWFDYYASRSEQLTQVATLGTLSHQVVSPKGASMEICGSGWNCTYTINFTAPGYKCTELARGEQLGDNKAPFGTELLLPEGNYSYYAFASAGDYGGEQFHGVSPGGIPITNDTLPKHLGAFRTEPIIWVGYSVWKDQNTKPPDNDTEPGWKDAFIPKLFACEHYVTDYEVEFNFTGNQQFTNVTKRNFRHLIIDTVYQPDKMAIDGTGDNTTATPEENYVYPNDTGPYRLVAAYHSLGAHLRDYVNGTITSNPVSNPNANTKAAQTKLVDLTREFFPFENLADRVQEFYEDIILSLFSYQQFLAVVWAAKPDTKSGATTTGPETGFSITKPQSQNGDAKDQDEKKNIDPSTLYNCTKSRYENRYRYIERDLWIVYAAAMLCALVAMVLGTAAVLENEGVLRNTKFSSIVAATRGPALEKVRWREDARGDITPDVKKMRVGYGVVHQSPPSQPLSGGGVGAFGGGGGGVGGLGVTSYNAAMDDFARYPRQSMVVGSPELQQQQQRFSSYSSPVGGGGEEVRYGFGLEGDVRQSRREGSMFRGR